MNRFGLIIINWVRWLWITRVGSWIWKKQIYTTILLGIKCTARDRLIKCLLCCRKIGMLWSTKWTTNPLSSIFITSNWCVIDLLGNYNVSLYLVLGIIIKILRYVRIVTKCARNDSSVIWKAEGVTIVKRYAKVWNQGSTERQKPDGKNGFTMDFLCRM